MTEATDISRQARNLLMSEYQGVLSTHSVDVPGYPFGSQVPYCIDRHGHIVILISRLAQHTKNIQLNPKVSLIVTEEGVEDIQTAARLTYLANAAKVPEDDNDTPVRYYRYFPKGRKYHEGFDFDFYRLELVRAHYVAGFGKIFWIAPEELLQANPFTQEEERSIVEHMNADHVDAMIYYCRTADIALGESVVPAMAGIDAEGFHLRLGACIVRFAFYTPVKSPHDVRRALVDMARWDS
jgi:Putative heme iron utilization protein